MGFDCADTRTGVDAEKMNQHHGALDVCEGVSRFNRGHIAHAEAELRGEMCLGEGTAFPFQL